tara:strand:- start:1610 stop:2713 length:1104 start_codon:yes stop_codon:yes gene_type:complete
MILSKRVKYIKIISISLFFFSFFSLVASLWLQNTLADFKFTKTADFKKLETANFISTYINCSKNLEICRIPDFKILKDTQRLGDCYPYEVEIEYILGENKIIKNHNSLFVNDEVKNGRLKPKHNNKNIGIVFKKINKKKPSCIKNNKVYNLYKIFPFYHEFLYALKSNPKTTLGASEQINPFIYGESSISNIVKRYPINYVFKSLLYISVIFMLLYWINYNILFKAVLNTKNNTFVYYGIISALFLFLHVTFLGVEIDNKAFKTFRKFVIVLFILSEVIAQFLLTLTLMKNKNNLSNYCKSIIINIKIMFICFVSLISLIVIFVLVKYDLSSKVDYILEWNYFAGLLFYYFLSFLIWKKLPNNPSST